MKLLTAVNLILPKLGEHTVTSVESKHPTLGIILPQIALQLDTELMPGWWFNTQPDAVLTPDVNKKIAVPVDALSFQGYESYPAMRSDFFWNSLTGTHFFDSAIKGTIIYRVPFEDLPESAAHCILYRACVEAYLTDIGREPIVQEWQRLQAEAYANLQREHLRHRKYSTTQSRRYQRRLSVMRA